MIRAYGKPIGFPKNKAVYHVKPLFLGWGRVARKFLEGFPGWLAMTCHDPSTEACRALWCRWWHCKRSVDVGDGNYPAALLQEIDTWTFSLPRSLKHVFFLFFRCLVLCCYCWCVDSFKIHFAKLQAIEGLSSTIWGKILVFFANSTTLLGGGFNVFDFHPYLGKCSNLTNIFQLGWNHHLV